MKAIKSTKMKKMFAVRHVIIDREDPEDSTMKLAITKDDCLFLV